MDTLEPSVLPRSGLLIKETRSYSFYQRATHDWAFGLAALHTSQVRNIPCTLQELLVLFSDETQVNCVFVVSCLTAVPRRSKWRSEKADTIPGTKGSSHSSFGEIWFGPLRERHCVKNAPQRHIEIYFKGHRAPSVDYYHSIHYSRSTKNNWIGDGKLLFGKLYNILTCLLRILEYQLLRRLFHWNTFVS